MFIYLKPKILYIGSPNEKSFLILLHCCLSLIDIKNWYCLLCHVYACKKNYKLELRLFKYIYQDQGLHILVSRMIFSWKERSVETKSFIGVYQES